MLKILHGLTGYAELHCSWRVLNVVDPGPNYVGLPFVHLQIWLSESVLIVNLTQPRVIKAWIEEFPRSDWPVGMSVEDYFQGQ